MLKELVLQNRSYRGFDAKYHFSEQQLRELVDHARLSPSSVNAQPFRYYLSWEAEEVARLNPLTNWAKGLPQLTLPHPGMEPTGFIIICQDMVWGESIARYQKDIGIVAQTILLAAAEQQLGGCMIGNFSPRAVKEALELSEGLEPVLIIALGKPAERVVLTEVGEDGSVAYYRDDEDVHYVPKRRLDDTICTKGGRH